jgi:ADP-ribose pyrophosphatase YjhB (NUDIX family)
VPDLLLNVHVVIFSLSDDVLQVLLSPVTGSGWELPGCLLEPGESLESAALRAFSDQFDRREAYLEQLYTYGPACAW